MEKNTYFNPKEETLTHAIAVTRILLEDSNDPNVRKAYLPDLKRRLNKFSDSEELLFYGVQLLFKYDEYDVAIQFLVSFLRRNAQCRSAWTCLARAILDLDEVLASACACRAMLLAENPALLANTKVELVICLESLANFDEYHWRLPISFFQEGAYLSDTALELC